MRKMLLTIFGTGNFLRFIVLLIVQPKPNYIMLFMMAKVFLNRLSIYFAPLCIVNFSICTQLHIRKNAFVVGFTSCITTLYRDRYLTTNCCI